MKNPRGAQNAGSSIGIKRCQAMSARIYGSQQQSEHLIGHVPDDHRHHDYDDDHFGCEVLSGKSKAGWLDGLAAMRISTESQFDDANKMRSPAIDCCRRDHRHALLMARKPARIRIWTRSGSHRIGSHPIGSGLANSDRATAKKPQLPLEPHSDSAATTPIIQLTTPVPLEPSKLAA